MAALNYYSHPYIRSLDEYQAELVSVAELAAHLLNRADEDSQHEWHRAGCWLMRDQLKALAARVPFPPEEALRLESEVAA